jgi:trimeric autotransporter adhesin
MTKSLTAAVIVLAASISAALAQSATNESFIYQIGDDNTVTVVQTGGNNTQNTLQGNATAPSFSNIASTTQVADPLPGGANLSTTIQGGPGFDVSDVTQIAAGAGQNTQLTIQTGAGNFSHTSQISHSALSNDSTTIQKGVDNVVHVSQK